MNKPVGGRGQKAPYETIQVRCPVPIKAEVDALIERYRSGILDKPESVATTENKPEYKFEKLDAIAQEILSDSAVTRNGKDRGSVKRGIEALLQRIKDNPDILNSRK